MLIGKKKPYDTFISTNPLRGVMKKEGEIENATNTNDGRV